MNIVVGAPMRGWIGPLGEVPDPVFAERMLGDGLAIDPVEGEVRAPCDARVLTVAATRHAITLELANGAELLIHVGLETVALGGEGFEAHVAAGAAVRAGDLLLAFDLDAVARRARSLITPIVVANEGFAIARAGGDRLVETGDALFEVRRIAGPRASARVGEEAAIEVAIPMRDGLHARPAARIAAALKPFAAEVGFAAHDRTANARSIVALLALGLAHGDRVRITARGSGARAAVDVVAALIASGMGEGAPPAPPPPAAPLPPVTGSILRGVRAAPGLAAGPVAQLRVADIPVPARGGEPEHELVALDRARAEVVASLTEGSADGIAAAHRALLDDPELLAAARRAIADGASAGAAWREATRAAADAIRATGDRRLIERVADLTDLERGVLARLYGAPPPSADPPDGAILIADELLPSQFLALDSRRLGGICTANGGPTAHVAILAASVGVPMLVAAGPAALALTEGRTVVLDADAGTLDTAPSPAALASVRARADLARTRGAAEAAAAHELCYTADGIRIEVFANLGSLADADVAVAAGAEGCGLLRTEFLFMDRASAPSEEEQRLAYAAIAARLGGRPLIVRTLDIGGDKPVPYLPIAREDNPALGLRGIRLSLARPELLAEQFRAILRGVPPAQCRIMVPMIVDAGEYREVQSLLDAARAAVGAAPVPLGVMIETPAAALLADSLAAEADFLSIGSNDLTQYALAADRGNPALAARIDPLHPAVLHLLALAAAGASRHGRWLGVCGGVASDPTAAALLIGLGVTELSATPAAVPSVKAAVRRLRLDDCRALARRALAADTARAVRDILAEATCD